ncbi:MAG TPA: serine/threonine-protein kinase [Thermomicrobiales bacterium]|nr:serine/threonine-protein kinase [Thermomicrobiales bacterium]
MRLSADDVLGAYRLAGRIGQGGMGEVYRARHLKLGREAAVKVLPLNLAGMADMLARFEREAASAAALQHPHILAVWDYGEHHGMPYLVMPYIAGGTLKDRLRERRLSAGEIAEFLRQMAAALDYAHERGIVHRDVKPANLLVDERGHLYLADFGIAKCVAEVEGLTGTGMGVGTPEYMAPEQAQGRVDARSDLYALGVILYQMLTGRVPYSGASGVEVLMKHLQEPLPLAPLREAAPALPPGVEAVVQKALAKDPDARYQTGRALAADFAAALAGAPPDDATRLAHAPVPAQEPAPAGAACPTPGTASKRLVAVSLEFCAECMRDMRRRAAQNPWLMGGLGALLMLLVLVGGRGALTLIRPAAAPPAATATSAARAGTAVAVAPAPTATPAAPTATPAPPTATAAPPTATTAPALAPTPAPTAAAVVPAAARPAATPQPRGTVPAGWQVYRGTRVPFAIAYPPGWTVDESAAAADEVTFYSPDRLISVLIRANGQPTPGANIDVLRDQYFKEVAMSCTRAGLESTSDETFSGITFAELAETCDRSGTLYMDIIGAGLNGGAEWDYVILCPYASYQAMAGQYFQAMFSTLDIARNP